ncbi:MAG: transketolase-like TK C-terminal-containing protein, partial [Bacteroidales bacterium]
APVALILSRQGLPVIDRERYAPATGALRGGYILADTEDTPEIILISTGSEVHQALEAFEKLSKEGIKVRVVSMPNWNLYERQDREYQESVLPSNVQTRISIEAGSTFGWNRFTGLSGTGKVMGMKTFGASGKLNSLLEEFGLTTDEIVKNSKSLIQRI